LSDNEDDDTDTETNADTPTPPPPPLDEVDEEKEWEELQASFRKKDKAMMGSINKRTHTVYAPNFPTEKNEWWWVYVAEKKRPTITSPNLLTAPVMVCNLLDEQEIELKFPAPAKIGPYTYTIHVRSDSYLDCDQKHDIKFSVKESKPQEDVDSYNYGITDDEQSDEASETEDDEGISSDEEVSDVDDEEDKKDV